MNSQCLGQHLCWLHLRSYGLSWKASLHLVCVRLVISAWFGWSLCDVKTEPTPQIRGEVCLSPFRLNFTIKLHSSRVLSLCSSLFLWKNSWVACEFYFSVRHSPKTLSDYQGLFQGTLYLKWVLTQNLPVGEWSLLRPTWSLESTKHTPLGQFLPLCHQLWFECVL